MAVLVGSEPAAVKRPDGFASARRAAVVLLAVCVVAALIVGLRSANPGLEPENRNWWLVAELAMALTYLPVGALLLERRGHRVLGCAFTAIGAGALLDALGTQYLAHQVERSPEGPGIALLAAAPAWAWALTSGLLVAVVPFFVPPGTAPRSTLARAGAVAGGLGVLVAVGYALTVDLSWPSDAYRLRILGSGAGTAAVATGARWLVGLAATAGLVVVGRSSWRDRRGDDPLPAWIFAGVAAAWLALVPTSVAAVRDRLGAYDVVVPLLLLVTIPLLVVGVLVSALRQMAAAPAGLRRFLEWFLLAAAIVLVYTGIVAGLGQLLGGRGPTWLLVTCTGLVAVAAEPGRRRLRGVVDRLVYGQRGDPLTVVRDVMVHVDSVDDMDELLPDVAATLTESLRLDFVAVDVSDGDGRGWRRAATVGHETARPEEMVLRHHDQVVGRLVVGSESGPALRSRDRIALRELAPALGLAIRSVQLATELRTASLAVVAARDEERRRLRRDLHDGVGPTLTGLSLALRTAVRRLRRQHPGELEDGTLAMLDRVADEIDGAVREVKRMARDLRPSVLDQLGLQGALAEYARTLDGVLDVQFDVAVGGAPVPAAVEVAAYRIATEALSNVVQHASAKHCWVRLTAGPDVRIDIDDDGVGIGADARPGVGLAAMRERAAELGGTVTIAPRRPCGTCLSVRLPAVRP